MISSEVHHLRVLHHRIVISLAIIPSLKTLVVWIVVLGIPTVYLEGGLVVVPRPVAHALTYPTHVNHVTSSLIHIVIMTHLVHLIILGLSRSYLLGIILLLLLLLLLLSLHSLCELSQKLTGWL